jgi:uncharacterized protein with ATP-grasp and redox domains
MEIRPECIPCLLRRVLFQAELAGNGTEFDALHAAVRSFSDGLRKGRNSAEMATEVHAAAYSAMNVKDPYLRLKIRADEVAEEYMGIAAEMISESSDPVRTAILAASAGNIMDFGLGSAIDDPDEFGKEFRRMMEQGLERDDTDAIKRILSDADSVVYVFDNCGEAQLDKLLIREIRKNGTKVIGIVRGEPILNDITLSDAYRIRMNEELDALYTTSEFRIGIDLRALEKELTARIKEADLMIAKGMANFESLSGQNVPIPLVHILRSKCAPVAEALGISMDINAVILK